MHLRVRSDARIIKQPNRVPFSVAYNMFHAFPYLSAMPRQKVDSAKVVRGDFI